MNSTRQDISEAMQLTFLREFPSEAAMQMESLPIDEIAHIFSENSLAITLPLWERFMPDFRVQLIEKLKKSQIVELLNHSKPPISASILGRLSTQKKKRYLNALNKEYAKDLQMLMSYPDDSAGFIMDFDVLTFRDDMLVEEAKQKLKGHKLEKRHFLFIVDQQHCLTDMVPIQDLVLAEDDATLSDIAKPIVATVQVTEPRANVVDIFEKQRLTDLPVIDFEGRLLGVIRYRDLVKATEAEASVALQTMVGVSKDERALSSISFSIKKRLPWLEINLLTAFLAAATVGLFEQTIAKHVALAILLPVVAGQSGNTGAQALAVTMRGLALREIRIYQWLQMIFKEVGVAFVNGVAIALTCALAVWFWSHSIGLTLIIVLSMIISMLIAGMAGTIIPILLTRIGQDPAQSSTIILTTVTDVVGFFSFLGIATIFFHVYSMT